MDTKLTLLMTLLFLCKESYTLRLVGIVVPPYRVRGSSVTLECLYELSDRSLRSMERRSHINHIDNGQQHELLYSVKWYKDNEEFYRFVPKANPPQHSYKVDGIKVDMHFSDSKRVVLKGLTLKSTGLYRCEVSAEAPDFASVQGDGRMEVVFFPRDGPHIRGKQRHYQVGDTLSLNCSSGKSHPASTLQWFINDVEVIDSEALIVYPETHHQHGLVTTKLGLNLILNASHFNDGIISFKCVASLSSALAVQGGMRSAVETKPSILEHREAMLLVRSSATQLILNVTLILLLHIII